MKKERKPLVGSMNAPIQGEAHVKVNHIKDLLTHMAEHKKLDGVSVRLSGNTSMHMDRINDTTLYLSNNRRMIYDVSFVESYNHTGKIPANHLVVGNMLLVVDDWAHIDDTDKFLSILNKKQVEMTGTKFYLDGVLYAFNVPFSQSESMRNDLIHKINDGEIKFHVLKIVDPSGNVTEFHASPLIEARMAGKEEEYMDNNRTSWMIKKMKKDIMNHGG